MKNKKVLHVFNSINHSGAELMYEAAADIFQKNGFKLHAVSTGNELGTFVKEFDNAGYKVSHLPYQRTYSFKYLLNFFPYFIKFYHFLKKENYAVLHIHRRHLFWMFALIGKFAGIPVIIRTIHNNFNPVWYRFPEYFLSRHFAKLLGVKMTSISDSVFENEKKLFVNKTIIIYNWFNHKRFYPITKEERKMTRSKLKISDQVIVLISTGSCLPQKRHKDIIFALKELVKKDYKVLYLHLGGGLLNNLEKELVNQLELKNEVRFLGNVNNVRDYLVASDFYIMPSEFEGLSIAAIEAMACKIPAILYNSPGLEELYRDDNLRKNLIKKSPSAITEKILELIENPSEINNIVENAYKMINLKFDMEKNVEQFIELYNNEK